MKINSNYTVLFSKPIISFKPNHINYRQKWLKNPNEFIVGDFPIHLDIEPTANCNLKCTFCDKAKLDNGRGFMDEWLYHRIIDEGRNWGLYSVKLSYRGEPLLHPNLVNMVKYAKDNGIIDIYFNTNGLLLTKQKSQELINAGIDRIAISIEGTTKEAYENNRLGSDFDVVLQNIKDFIKIRGDNLTPRISVQTVSGIETDLTKYKEFWSQLVDEVAYIDYKDPKRNTDLIWDWSCPHLWQRMTIRYNGDVSPCNNDDSGIFILGNVSRDSIYKLWNDYRVNLAREFHKKGESHKVWACNGCPCRTTQILKEWGKII